jgi:hypothetical protein
LIVEISNPQQMKVCGDCRQLLPLTAFRKDKNRRLGLKRICRECASFEDAKRRGGGIRCTVGAVSSILAQQDGKCAICDLVLRERTGDRRACIDHDHGTGEIRGILCSNCNRALGLFKDNERTIGRALAYLQRHSVAMSDPRFGPE